MAVERPHKRQKTAHAEKEGDRRSTKAASDTQSKDLNGAQEEKKAETVEKQKEVDPDAKGLRGDNLRDEIAVEKEWNAIAEVGAVEDELNGTGLIDEESAREETKGRRLRKKSSLERKKKRNEVEEERDDEEREGDSYEHFRPPKETPSSRSSTLMCRNLV